MTPGWNRVARAAVALEGRGAAPAQHDAHDDDRRWERARSLFVERQIIARGIRDQRVLEAMRRVPRHHFVPPEVRAVAYADRPLGIGHDQTISQPYIVALMSEALELRGYETVLEIGTGSGYQAAVLALLAATVHSVEIIPELAARARLALQTAGFAAVHVHSSDGTFGWPAAAPYDAIVVTAAPEAIPQLLVEQLRPGGRLVLPVGPADDQQLLRLVRTATGVERQCLVPVRFVPMTGAARLPKGAL